MGFAIHHNVFLLSVDNLSVGNNVSIHPMCHIDVTGGINIGNDVSIAHSVTVMSFKHEYKDITVAIKDQSVKLLPTLIMDNVWIG